MDDDTILSRGGDQHDIDQAANQNGADFNVIDATLPDIEKMVEAIVGAGHMVTIFIHGVSKESVPETYKESEMQQGAFQRMFKGETSMEGQVTLFL